MAQTLNYSKVKSDTGSGLTPIGTILPWAKAIAPEGFLKCDGTAVSRTTFADLFSVIGTTYGSGDGSTTFNLPNLTSRVPVQANTTANVGQTGGAHDTDGAGFSLQNNLSSASFNNLTAQTTDNLAIQTTQNLSVQTAQNLATDVQNGFSGQVTNNLAVQNTQNLSGSGAGNIDNTTLSLAQIPSHNHPGVPYIFQQTRGTPGGSNRLAPTSIGNAGSNQAHNHGNNVSFSLTGNAVPALSGDVTVAVPGTITAAVTGNVAKAVAGNVAANKTGNVATNINGSVSAAINGNVDAQNSSLFSPHVVVIYIIKH